MFVKIVKGLAVLVALGAIAAIVTLFRVSDPVLVDKLSGSAVAGGSVAVALLTLGLLAEQEKLVEVNQRLTSLEEERREADLQVTRLEVRPRATSGQDVTRADIEFELTNDGLHDGAFVDAQTEIEGEQGWEGLELVDLKRVGLQEDRTKDFLVVSGDRGFFRARVGNPPPDIDARRVRLSIEPVLGDEEIEAESPPE